MTAFFGGMIRIGAGWGYLRTPTAVLYLDHQARPSDHQIFPRSLPAVGRKLKTLSSKGGIRQ